MNNPYIRVDDHYHWVEGQKKDINGNLAWWPLYCYRANDLILARGVLTHILRKANEGLKLPDELDTFEDFRLRTAGTPTEAIPNYNELRNPAGGFALAQQLRKLKPFCGVIHPTRMTRCVLMPGHSGKHRDH